MADEHDDDECDCGGPIEFTVSFTSVPKYPGHYVGTAPVVSCNSDDWTAFTLLGPFEGETPRERAKRIADSN